ncbi:MAG: V-type ATP synthase subunit E [Nitrospira sp.]|nr:V-type ATP synthase subunit E [Nitrospira sp.]
MTGSENLSKMGEALLGEAQREAAQIIERAEKDAVALKEATEREGQQIVQNAVAQEETIGRREARRKLAAADLEGARLFYTAREEILHQCFDRLNQALRDVPHQQDYLGILENLVEEAADSLQQSEIVLGVRPADSHLVTPDWCQSLGARLEITIQVSPEPAHIDGGVVVSSQNGRLRFDQSFEALVKRHEEALRSIMAQQLWEPEPPSKSSGILKKDNSG